MHSTSVHDARGTATLRVASSGTPTLRVGIRDAERRGTGFTLIETIAAIVVLAIAIPPMLFAIRDSHVQRIGPVMASQARWLASEKLEDIIADRHSTTRGYDYLDAANYADESPVTGFAAFDRTVTFTETEADLSTPGSGYMTATVSVSWTDASGTARTLALSTVLTELE